MKSLQVCTGAVALIFLSHPVDLCGVTLTFWHSSASQLPHPKTSENILEACFWMFCLFCLAIAICGAFFVWTLVGKILLRSIAEAVRQCAFNGVRRDWKVLPCFGSRRGRFWLSEPHSNVLFQDTCWLRWQRAANRLVGKSTDTEARKVTSDLAKAENDKCAPAEHGT